LKNYYAILEVPIGCSLEEIRQAYRRLVQEHLDDAAVFADLREAYEVLSTPARRAEYDQSAWGETFDANSPSAVAGPAQAGRCPMGAEAQCPVLQGRTPLSDRFCPECGYALAGLGSGATFDAEQPGQAKRAWLEDRSGQSHPLRSGTNVVGRESGEVLVSDKTVSRSHARLELGEDGRLSVEDLSSTNGTQVNDEALTPHVLRSLADGDHLRFGSVYLILHLPALEANTPETDAVPEAGSAAPSEMLLSARAQLAGIREGAESVFLLTPGLTTFGRRPGNTVVLTGDLYVSGSHAQISADADVFILTDIGSTNGTLLNGERLPINTPFTLDDGDEILIGGTALRFERLEPSPEPVKELDSENIHSEEALSEETPLEEPVLAGDHLTETNAAGDPEQAEG
jgi:pSer/pThr/pTyr-binding forkhead associated (FHA) protein